VENPRHVVYADLPGFGLSTLGLEQAAAAGIHLASSSVSAVLSSPLERAVATAKRIAAPHDLSVVTDARLTEWRLGQQWAGIVWEDLPSERPGELEAYLAAPEALGFVAESLDDLAQRMIAVMNESASLGGAVVLVSHQDPVQAARRIATGGSLRSFHETKPGHASITTLEPADTNEGWVEVDYWAPDQGHEFPPVSSNDGA
jgi:broad specificity phosphatase PhoE